MTLFLTLGTALAISLPFPAIPERNPGVIYDSAKERSYIQISVPSENRHLLFNTSTVLPIL